MAAGTAFVPEDVLVGPRGEHRNSRGRRRGRPNDGRQRERRVPFRAATDAAGCGGLGGTLLRGGALRCHARARRGMGPVCRLPLRPAPFRAARVRGGDDPRLQPGASQGRAKRTRDTGTDRGPLVARRPVRRDDSPDFRGWERNIGRALRTFSEGSLGKVVLARRAEIGFDGDLDATLLLEGLKEATPNCFHFYTEPEAGVAFLGASPERLFSREGNMVVSEAVAGTRPRGLSSEDDDGLREDLLHSAKDRSEHTYVRTGIEEALAPLCEELNLDGEVVEMKLARGRHLKSMVRGTLKDGVTDAGLLEALHPTPAVGGHPRDGALAEIRDLEPFDRGLYAGPVGWIGAWSSEFAVGIRSGLVRGRTLDLYSGAGIVAGSVPDEEWAEIENKISDFTGMFGLEQGNAAS